MKKHIYLTELNSLPQMFLDHLKISKSNNLLDFGCGYGFWFYLLKHHNLLPKYCVGVDLDKEHIESLVNNTVGVGIVGDITKVKFHGGFDLAICNQAIEHTPDDKAVVNNLYKSLNKGGILFLSSIMRLPYAWYIYRYQGEVRLSPHHFREYKSLKEFTDLAENAGFKILKAHSPQYWLQWWTTPILKGRLAIPIPGFKRVEILCQKI